MWTPECYFRPLKLPRTLPGVVLPNDDGTFDVYINSRLSEAEQALARQHEIDHIIDEHFYSDKPVGLVEAEARGDVEACPSDDEWLYDAYGLPLEPMPEHEPGTKVIPLYTSPNAMVDIWRKAGMLDELLAAADQISITPK